MAKITAIIPNQQYEVVRDRLGEILAEELANQYELGGEDEEVLNATVWVERCIPFNSSELPAINVLVGRGDYSNKHQGQVDGAYAYYIDGYTSSPSTEDGDGDKLSAIKLQRLMGVCRAILENQAYKTLDWLPGTINSVAVNSLVMAEPHALNDANSQMQGRLEVLVVTPETTQDGNSLPLSMSLTSVKLVETNMGYRYEHNPNAILAESGMILTNEEEENLIIE